MATRNLPSNMIMHAQPFVFVCFFRTLGDFWDYGGLARMGLRSASTMVSSNKPKLLKEDAI